jgi:hypothetical protein
MEFLLQFTYVSDVRMLEMTIHRCDFNSSFIQFGTYNDETKTLTLFFQGKEAGYDFYIVPMELWLKLINAESPGSVYNSEIRDKY